LRRGLRQRTLRRIDCRIRADNKQLDSLATGRLGYSAVTPVGITAVVDKASGESWIAVLAVAVAGGVVAVLDERIVQVNVLCAFGSNGSDGSTCGWSLGLGLADTTTIGSSTKSRCDGGCSRDCFCPHRVVPDTGIPKQPAIRRGRGEDGIIGVAAVIGIAL